MDTVSDETLNELRQYAERLCVTAPPGMCGVSADVLLDMVIEIQTSRERPLHCPGCDGDHL